MKEICEIYDISQEYELPTNTMLIIVSEMNSSELIKCLPVLESYRENFMSSFQWENFLKTRRIYNNNEDKHRMRGVKRGVSEGLDETRISGNDELFELLSRKDLSHQFDEAFAKLTATQKRRFEMYYFKGFTYRKIGEIEGKNAKTIFESVNAAKKKFLSFFE